MAGKLIQESPAMDSRLQMSVDTIKQYPDVIVGVLDAVRGEVAALI